MERELKEQLEKITSQLHNVETKLGDVSKQLDKSEKTSTLRETWTDSFMGIAFFAASIGLLLAGATVWYAGAVGFFGVYLIFTSTIRRVRIRIKRRS